MKKKALLSLIMAAAITLGGAAMATNANFNAVAHSNGNIVKMGTVRLLVPGVAEGQTINLSGLFTATNMGTSKTPMVKETTIVNSGTLPVTLSMDKRTAENTIVPTGVISTYYRHYKMAVSMQLIRNGVPQSTIWSRTDDPQLGHYDAIFDTIDGETNHIGSAQTTGIDPMLKSLGVLQPGDKVTIKTYVRFDQTAWYTTNAVEHTGQPARIDGWYTLTQNEVNAFQGKTLAVNLTIVATEK